MRSKKLSRHLKKAFGADFDEEAFPRLIQWLGQSAESSEKDQILAILEGLPELFVQVEQSYTQSEERVFFAQRSLEVSTEELTVSNKNHASLNQTFKAMVNSLDQGFFLFSKDGTCLDFYSQICESLLEVVPRGCSVTEVLKVPPEKRAGFLDWCSMLFEEPIEFDELARLGPKSFNHSQNKVISLEYKAVRNQSNQIESVVVIATDKTEEVEATARAKELHAYSTLVMSILKDRGNFLQFIKHSRSFFSAMKVQLKNEPFTPTAFAAVKRHLHTLKGAASTFGMFKLREFVHDIESNISKHRGLPAAQVFLTKTVGEAEALFDKLLVDNQELIGKVSEGADVTREIPLTELQKFGSYLKASSSDLSGEAYTQFLSNFICTPIESCLIPFNRVLKETARETGKEVSQLLFSGENLSIFPEAYEEIWQSLSHLFRNMVDHGIESPAVRLQRSKPTEGRISAHCRQLSAGQFVLEIGDDGGGINAEIIREKLLSQGRVEAESWTETQLFEQIFSSGFSTKDAVTEISGRGVGLDVVRSAIVKMSGAISVESKLGTGTKFVITLPLLREPKDDSFSAVSAA